MMPTNQFIGIPPGGAAGYYPYTSATPSYHPHMAPLGAANGVNGFHAPPPGAGAGYAGMPPPHQFSANSAGMAAVFKKRVERIDWRKIAALDVDRVIRDMDFQSLQENLMNITFCSLESEVDCRNMDPNFMKLFKISQLSIEYLLYSQDYLANIMTGMESRLNQVVMDHETTKSQLEKQKQELILVKKESHKRKKLLAAQQQILHSGAGNYHKCPFCPKAFVHESYCVSHIQRRHPDQATVGGISSSTSGSPTNHVSVSHSSRVTNHVTKTTVQSNLEMQLKELTERLLVTEQQLNEEKSHNKSEADLMDQNRLMESWKNRQKERHREEFDEIRQMFLEQFEELNDKYLHSERQLMHLRGRPTAGQTGTDTRSNLGDLADDTDTEGGGRGRHSLNIRNAYLSPEGKSLKNKMDDHTFTLEQQNQAEIARLDAVLKNSLPGVSPPASLPNTPKHKSGMNGYAPGGEDMIRPISLPVEESMMTRDTAATAASAASPLPGTFGHPASGSGALAPNLDLSDLIKTAPSSITQKGVNSPSGYSPRGSSPGRKRSPERVLSPGERPVFDHSEDDVDDDDESELKEVNQEFTLWTKEQAVTDRGLSESLNSTGPADMNQGTDESLIATKIRNTRLKHQLSKDPGLLKGLRVELDELLAEQLEEKGITRDLTGISNVVLNSKLDVMEREREIMDRKYSNFHKIRRQYERKVNREAFVQLEHMKNDEEEENKKRKKNEKNKNKGDASPRPPPKAQSMPDLSSRESSLADESPVPLRRNQKKGPGPGIPQSPRRSPLVMRKETAPSPVQQPPPRISTTLSTDYSSAAPDTQDDDDYSESESEYTEETEPKDQVDNAKAKGQGRPSGLRIIQSGPPPPPPRSPEPEPEPTPRRAKSPKTPTEKEEISEWDSTEMSEIKPANVKQLSYSIDSKLKNRPNTDRPFGGVNTMPSKAKTTVRHVTIETPTVDDDDDDLSISVSSLQDLPKAAPRRAVHASAEGEGVSTNTGGTSVWGSGSKAPGGHIVGKSSQSLTDWDSDLDIDDL